MYLKVWSNHKALGKLEYCIKLIQKLTILTTQPSTYAQGY